MCMYMRDERRPMNYSSISWRSTYISQRLLECVPYLSAAAVILIVRTSCFFFAQNPQNIAAVERLYANPADTINILAPENTAAAAEMFGKGSFKPPTGQNRYRPFHSRYPRKRASFKLKSVCTARSGRRTKREVTARRS